ncbi:MAG: gamma-glutamylcyclotransferase [Alphaproteobacteria bacterium]|nr:gamma-glutamylcyclotransferase [Alphaproteobacteria bacterium]
MKTPPAEQFYSIELPPGDEIEPTLADCDRWVADVLAGLGAHGDFWIFAYGSLIWHTDFPVLERTMARAHGYHRAFCIYSVHYRGTWEKPGLVLGLDRGGSCRGVALRVARDEAEQVAHYLWRREIVSHAYRPRALTVTGERDGRKITAHCFVADPGHALYAGGLDVEETVRLIRRGVGHRGPNPDYLDQTVAQLEALGIVDRSLARLNKKVRAVRAY